MSRRKVYEDEFDTASLRKPASTFESRLEIVAGLVMFVTGALLLLYGPLRFDWSDDDARPVIVTAVVLGVLACSAGASLLALASLKKRRP